MKQNNNNGPVYAGAAVVCVLIITLGVLFSGVLTGKSVGPQGGTLSMVSVSASGTAKGIPSMATVDLFINATGNSSSQATTNLSAKLTAFNKTAYNYVGGNTSLIKTQYYNVGKMYSNNSKAAPVYEAQEYVIVTLPQVSRLDGFLGNITGVSGLQVQDVSADLSDAQISQLRQQALQTAISNATAQAQSIIGTGMIVNTNVSVGSYNAYPFPIYTSVSGGPAVPSSSQLYYNGTSSVYENIQVTFYYRR